MKFHPYAEVFPLLDGPAFDELVADVKEFGLREKIWVYEDKILDGRNRFLACKQAKVTPLFRYYRGDIKGALSLVISNNVRRRHLSESQRAMAAARLANATAGDNQHSEDVVPIGTTSEMLNVSARSVKRAKKVVDKGSKALQRAVEADEIAVSRAAGVVDLPKAEQLKAATQKADPKPVEVAPAPDFDFTDYEPEDDEAYQKNIENVMMADDKLAAMREELKQVYRQMQGLKASRDHYQSEAGMAVRLVKARDRELEKLRKELVRAQERIATLEA